MMKERLASKSNTTPANVRDRVGGKTMFCLLALLLLIAAPSVIQAQVTSEIQVCVVDQQGRKDCTDSSVKNMDDVSLTGVRIDKRVRHVISDNCSPDGSRIFAGLFPETRYRISAVRFSGEDKKDKYFGTADATVRQVRKGT